MNDTALIKDASQNRWIFFRNPVCVLTTTKLTDVEITIAEVEKLVRKKNLFAAGFLAYEAAPAFDSALSVSKKKLFPLVWFGLYETAKPFFLPQGDQIKDFSLQWLPTVTRITYEENFRRIKRHIAAGDCYQVNYSFRLRSTFSGRPFPLFTTLTSSQKPPYAAFIETNDWALLSASPELFFTLDSNTLISKPMKGTAPRGRTFENDLLQAKTLYNSEKERAENLMIVDMVRNDIGKVAKTGSVHVPHLFQVEKHPTLWQMTSSVTGQTKAGFLSIFGALFPAASVTGAPKPRVTEIITELERDPRQIYTGTIGFITPNRRAQFNVAIRTLLIDKRRRQVEYGVGSGIVWDSDPAKEYEECFIKARILGRGVSEQRSVIARSVLCDEAIS